MSSPWRCGRHTSQWRHRALDASKLDVAADAGDGSAADPDRPVLFARDVDSAGPIEGGSLAYHVWSGRAPGAEQPLRQRGIEAPGHGVFERRAVARDEGAHL